MPNKFRLTRPKRTCTKTYKSYRSYKSYLANDFNNRCGYTDCPDFWFGGKNNFHIDHFKPYSKNPDLVSNYSNLVYCCSYVNILKSDDEGSYIDPCEIDFNDHFERLQDGTIIPVKNSVEAIYMHTKLKLGLVRYSLIWKLDEMFQKKIKLQSIIDKTNNEEIKGDLLQLYYELDKEFSRYMNYLKANQ
ncbi:hypothetical protein [Christiangramia sp. LLG6405-1]|uniref:hypothetical protein n=1 Tax=Christiangramia sp. LLG6405-1 TaxID=3160832 RepID=UPI00386BA09C